MKTWKALSTCFLLALAMVLFGLYEVVMLATALMFLWLYMHPMNSWTLSLGKSNNLEKTALQKRVRYASAVMLFIVAVMYLSTVLKPFIPIPIPEIIFH